MPYVVEELLESVLELRWEDVPPSTRARARRALADTLASTVAGESADGVDPLRAQLRLWGGRPEATVVGWGDALPAPAAAWLNATMGRAWDFDDCHEETGDHPSVAAVSATLAAAQLFHVDRLRDVLLAIIASAEFVIGLRKASTARLSTATPWSAGTYAPLTAAVSVAKLAGTDRETAVNALGIAFTEMSSTNQSQAEGALAHRIHQGSAVAAGVTAVLLAQRGVTGAHALLEGPFGLFQAYMNNAVDVRRLRRAPGSSFLLDEVSLKPYPSCRLTHGPVFAATRLAGGEPGPPDRVASATVRVNRQAFLLCGGAWSSSHTPVAAQFSLPYTVAAALIRGKLDLEDFSARSVADASVAELAARIEVVHDPALDTDGGQVGPSSVTLRFDDGAQRTVDVPVVLGHPRHPLSDEAFAAKLASCVRARGDGDGEKAAQALNDLLSVDADGPFLEVLDRLRRPV